jgi:hypothetical protein
MRVIASLPGYNSQKLIPVHLGSDLTKISYEELKNFDALLLYNYRYSNYHRAWSKLEKYVEEGGKIFIDTGTEVKEARGYNLPKIFPSDRLERKSLGSSWQLKGKEEDILREVNLNNFAPPLFDQEEWNFSYPVDPTDLRKNSEVILTNYDKPILTRIKLGTGKVIWSGMNLPYHIVRYKQKDEIKLFQNILENLINFKTNLSYQSIWQRPSPQKVIIRGDHKKGVLFKESAFRGWRAKVESGSFSQKLKIYPAGPHDPGYMYVFLPPSLRDKSFTVTFKYYGDWQGWFTNIITGLTFLVLLDLILFKRIFIRFLLFITSPLRRRIALWWAKED